MIAKQKQSLTEAHQREQRNRKHFLGKQEDLRSAKMGIVKYLKQYRCV